MALSAQTYRQTIPTNKNFGAKSGLTFAVKILNFD